MPFPSSKLPQVREFNLALLEKWCWRMLVDKEGLWFRVLVVREGGELGDNWFWEHVSKKVGDGSDTFFWTDPWVDGIPLSERFGRLFDLAGNKLQTVAEMFSLGHNLQIGSSDSLTLSAATLSAEYISS
ncbi:hypothetical protein TSUD_318110 [Trifolium subterraneum]|uniref:Reverse transcriptase zinc-binding domain-containing protein n=1 Tax=Trifolium subterraneum TaxID=3900 RepID=A0A2Z6N053_TRISU|nr:hypothetical protein TSUD_318110 [Trifolium subterraneum]